MEKTGTGNNRKQRFGLLTSMALLVMLAGIFFPQQLSAAPSWNYMTSLRFRQCEDYFFTKSSCSYSVDIKGVDPNEVTVYMNSIPDNVELLTIKKDTYIPPASEADIGFGTHVTVTVRFAQSGDYTLHPVDMQIGGGYYQVRFERVHVYENIQVIQPQLSIRFANPQYAGSKNIATAKVGDHILFTVCVRYAAQITGLSWNLPENSLFTEERRYDIVEKNPHHEFSPDAVPVITFDWQPLVPGTYELPLVSVTANAYSGISVNLSRMCHVVP